ncbi:MAG: transglycosylase domain-containing protein, partial [Bradymonadaceae bacterium]
MIAQGQRLRYIPAEPEPAIVGPVRAQTEQGGEERAAGKGDAPLWAHGVMGLAVLCVAAMGWAIYEAQTSRWQSEHFAERAAELSYDVERGRSPAVVDAPRGPHDRRVGHVELPMFNERLEAQGLRLTHQARVSPIFRELVEEGIFPIYRVKDQTGLRIRDAQRRRVYSFAYPRRVFESFEEIPELIVETLLFIENRNLLDPDFPRANPAVDFRRVLRAIIDQSLYMLGSERDVPGGSTLATQMEKFRHSPAGRTETIGEKWQQMLSASYRAYLDGPETRASSQRVVKDYVNSVPLGARAGWGEVHGLGDGLLAWFGSDLDEVNEALRSRPNPGDSEAFAAYGRAYRMVLSLILAQQRPTVFLPKNIDALNERSAMFLRVLAREGVIDEKLRDEALAWPVELVELVPQVPVEAQLDEKTLDGLQAGLTSLLGLERRYDLIRLDLEVETSLDVEAQEAVRERLEKLADPAFIKSAGLRGRTRIGHGDPEEIVYGFTLYERGADGHRLRVQVDTHDSQMDLNAASKLDLGSTAKLRTLTHYLEVIEALYEELGVLSAEERADLEVHREDRLTHWAITYLRRNPDATVEEMLEASMSRRYSADPHQSFWTGGGRHRFGNASRRHNGAVLDVWRAFRESANLPFVRMMSDIVHYHIGRLPDDVARVLDDRRDPRREELLMRFAGRDAEKFVGRFYAGFHGREADEVLERVLRGQRRTLTNDAIIFRHVLPGADVEAFGEFMATRGRRLGEARLQQLFDAHGPGEDELFERRTRHDINPLELWVARFVLENPEASRAEVMVASEGVREDALEWLLWTETALEQR